MATNAPRHECNDNRDNKCEKKRCAPLNLATIPCPNAIVNNATGVAAAACNQADCIICTTINLYSPYVSGTPFPSTGELWIRHIDSAFGMLTERQGEEMKACMEAGDRILNLTNHFVLQQKHLIEEMKRINRSLDKTLEGRACLDEDDDILHDSDADNIIIEALTQLRSLAMGNSTQP